MLPGLEPDERASVAEHGPVGRLELGLLVSALDEPALDEPAPDEPAPEPELVPAPLGLGGEDEPGREDGPELELVHVPGPGPGPVVG